jgi:hypothetical protein
MNELRQEAAAARRLARLFARWSGRGYVGGVAYYARLLRWLRRHEQEVRPALPKLRQRWPEQCAFVAGLLGGD